MRLTVRDIARLPADQRAAVFALLSPAEADALYYDWTFWARDNQLAPDGAWGGWLILTGRGWGKTRTGAQWVRQRVAQGFRRIALVAETAADARDVLVEGESGILAISPPWDMPKYEPSKRRLTWPNGAVASTFSGEEPDQLRGPQHDTAWVDELAKYRYPAEAWSNLMFGLRLGNDPRVVITTTPRPIPIIRELVADPRMTITRGTLYENADNLAPTFIEWVRGTYEGTRLGRQEIGGEILDDNPGALWQRAIIEQHRVLRAPAALTRVAVAIDPQGSAATGMTGIVGAGRAGPVGLKSQLYVLEDASMSGTPEQWGRAAVTLYHKLNADVLVAETNFGGDMVAATIRTIDPRVNVKVVSASRGKAVRAEPVSTIYEQGRAHHVGSFPLLEDELCQWEPGMESPHRLDALVWAGTELMLGAVAQQQSLPGTGTYAGA